MNYSWGTDRRFNAYADYFRREFGQRVQKLSVNAGFTCPNRDGTVGRGGCTFCDNRAFTPSYNNKCKSVSQQLLEGIEFHKVRYRKVTKFLAYFQSYSNTYAPLEDLKRIYQPAFEHPDVIGIIIGTRPDCIDLEKLDYFTQLAKVRYLVIEYGIESISNATLKKINRGHTFEQTVWAINETAERGIHTGGHMIIGLPGETRKHWIDSIDILSTLPLHSIKFHHLQLIKGTAMEKEFNEDSSQFTEFEMEDYLHLITELIERLNPAIIVERIAGEINPLSAVRTGWGVRYEKILHRFEEILSERNTWQGKNWQKAI